VIFVKSSSRELSGGSRRRKITANGGLPLRHEARGSDHGNKEDWERVMTDEEERIGKAVVEAAFRVHKRLGPGLLESVYERCVIHELGKMGVGYRSQAVVPVVYDGVMLEAGLRADLIVSDKVVVELKSVDHMQPVFVAQLLTYLKLTGLRLGFLINFNVPAIRHGIQRVVL
jgi:GxxExxY protein